MISAAATMWPELAIEVRYLRYVMDATCEDCSEEDGPCACHARRCEVCFSNNAINHGAWTAKKDQRGHLLQEAYCDKHWEDLGT